jgi:Protein of unknown function (DUF664)
MSIAVASSIDPRHAAVSSGSASSPGGSVCAGALTRSTLPRASGRWRLHDLREILLHVIAETGCHGGHLDAARELIDGRQWIVLSR